jgi:hypothetical protein
MESAPVLAALSVALKARIRRSGALVSGGYAKDRFYRISSWR